MYGIMLLYGLYSIFSTIGIHEAQLLLYTMVSQIQSTAKALHRFISDILGVMIGKEQTTLIGDANENPRDKSSNRGDISESVEDITPRVGEVQIR